MIWNKQSLAKKVKSTCAMVKRPELQSRCPHESQFVRKQDHRLGTTMVRLMHAETHWSISSVQNRFLWTPNRMPQAKPWIPLETLVHHKADVAQWAVAQLSNGKAGPCTRCGGPADQGRYGGAVAKL